MYTLNYYLATVYNKFQISVSKNLICNIFISLLIKVKIEFKYIFFLNMQHILQKDEFSTEICRIATLNEECTIYHFCRWFTALKTL